MIGSIVLTIVLMVMIIVAIGLHLKERTRRKYVSRRPKR